MNEKHTPGPWEASQLTLGGLVNLQTPYVTVGDGDDLVIIAELPDARENPDSVANAHLIAAAPEMLAVLESIRAHFAKHIAFGHGDALDKKALNDLSRVIDKATRKNYDTE